MAAVEGSVFSYEDIDVFTVPHNRMKELLNRISKKAKRTDYSNHRSFSTLLKELSATFLELKNHEEIENKCIMKILKRKLQGEALKKLLVHLHAHSHISDILKQVRNVEDEFQSGVCSDLINLGFNLNNAIQEFFDEYVPHMKEEEQVLQPMLMEFLPLNELHQIRQVVLQLHQAKNIGQKSTIEKVFSTQIQQLALSNKVPYNELPAPHREQLESSTHEDEIVEINSELGINSLPVETLTQIFSYLGPKELCRCAQINHTWNTLAFNGTYWKTLHPPRWGIGEWSFGGESSDDCNCDCEPNYDLMTYLSEDHANSVENLSSSSTSATSSDISEGEECSDDQQVFRESKILHGLCRYVLPRVGSSVKTLVMECSKAITNGLMFRILSQCKNLEYLDASQTIISDLGLMGLFKNGSKKLKYLDVSGCRGITDKSLTKLSLSLGKTSNNTCASCTCSKQAQTNTPVRQITTLRLSGCYKITDVGLRSLGKYGGLPSLRHLDLSGCFNVSNTGIEDLVNKCSRLDMNELFYCDNIATESYDHVAGGCQNQGCSNRVCCRTGLV